MGRGPMNPEPIAASRSRVAAPDIRPAPGGAAPRLARPDPPDLDWMDRRLLDAYQCDFPVCETPFAEIARRLHRPASEVLQRLGALERRGVVSRIGPVFAPGRVGASTLVAMAVPSGRLESVVEWVNRHGTASHSHEREHEFNLWFVLEAPNAGALYETLANIRRRTGLDALDLRPERTYEAANESPLWQRPPRGRCPPLDASDRRLLGAIQDGLPLTARPYAVVADRIGLSEAQVIERLGRLLREGVITRIGLVVRHHRLGYGAHAVVAFDVPCARVDLVGKRLARAAPVARCDRRTRRLPMWPYNLYCTLHGRDRAEVMGWVDERLGDACGDLRHTVLFSRRRLRRCGARDAPDHAPPQSEPRASRRHRKFEIQVEDGR